MFLLSIHYIVDPNCRKTARRFQLYSVCHGTMRKERGGVIVPLIMGKEREGDTKVKVAREEKEDI